MVILASYYLYCCGHMTNKRFRTRHPGKTIWDNGCVCFLHKVISTCVSLSVWENNAMTRLTLASQLNSTETKLWYIKNTNGEFYAEVSYCYYFQALSFRQTGTWVKYILEMNYKVAKINGKCLRYLPIPLPQLSLFVWRYFFFTG